MEHLPRRLLLIAIAVSATFAFGTLGFIWIEDYPPFDAFYMTLTTVTTVGRSCFCCCQSRRSSVTT